MWRDASCAKSCELVEHYCNKGHFAIGTASGWSLDWVVRRLTLRGGPVLTKEFLKATLCCEKVIGRASTGLVWYSTRYCTRYCNTWGLQCNKHGNKLHTYMYKRRAGPGSGPRSFKNTHTQCVCVFLKLLGPSPGPQGVGLPTRDTGVCVCYTTSVRQLKCQRVQHNAMLIRSSFWL